MGKFIKQAGLALASFGLATAALAGSYTEGCDCEITIPKFAGGIRVGVEALYFAADIKNTDYAVTSQSRSGIDTFRGHNVDTDRDWGFALELAYVVAGTGNDFVVNWTEHRFSSGSKVSEFGGNSNTRIISPIAVFVNLNDDAVDDIDLDSPEIDGDDDLLSVSAKSALNYRKIDLEAGQAIKIGHDSVCLRFHAGLRYAGVDTKYEVFYENDDRDLDENGTFVSESDFDGLGPRFGIDGYWHLGNGFSVVGEASVAMLVGTAKASWAYEDIHDEDPPVDYSARYSESFDNTIVSNLEGRIGVNYLHHFSNSSEMNIQVGYQVTHYFDVDYKIPNPFLNDGGTDVGMSGLYFKVDYTI